MTRNGWANDDTWMVVAACDNTDGFDQLAAPLVARAAAGDARGAAEELRVLVTVTSAVDHLHSSIDYSLVDWTEIVTTWARDAA